MIRFYWLILGMLCVWRITHLIQAEDGPWELAIRVRKIVGNGFWGTLLDCFYCLSLWVSAPIAYVIGETLAEKLLLWPALSAGAILVERVANREEEILPAPYIEEVEDEHVLRQTEATVSGDSPSKSGH